MTKKIIIALIALILIVSGYFIGKSYYYNKIFNYSKVIKTNMEKYYKSNDTTDIDSIKDLITLYDDNDEIVIDIQNKVFVEFNDWYEYTSNKYNCTLESVNQCILYEKELEDLSFRLPKLELAGIIESDKEQMLAKQIDTKIEEAKTIISDPNATSGETYEEHRQAICKKVSEDNCELQRDGTSYCQYVLGSTKEIVKCKIEYKQSSK